MAINQIEDLIRILARLPGLGPRSARRAVLYMMGHEGMMPALAAALVETASNVKPCPLCGNLDTVAPCGVCSDPTRNAPQICVVEQVADLWAIERSGVFQGRYHVLGGTLSALDGVGPEDLGITRLMARLKTGDIDEVILALNVTLEGQTTAHYLANHLKLLPVDITHLAQGVPIGGELDYLDDGTLSAAFSARRPAA